MTPKDTARVRPATARPLSELEAGMPAPQPLPDRIYSTLKHRILTCSLQPAERIVEKELTQELGVSRTPLREALNRLALENLVVLTPYRGYAVAPILLDEIRNLLEVRLVLESASAAYAAERVENRDIDELRKLATLRYQPGNRATYEYYLHDNSAFHQALARCTRNARLESMIASVLDQIQRLLYLGLDFGLDAEAATAEHYEVIDALAKHDPERARNLMAEQIKRTELQIISAASRLLSEKSVET